MKFFNNNQRILAAIICFCFVLIDLINYDKKILEIIMFIWEFA